MTRRKLATIKETRKLHHFAFRCGFWIDFDCFDLFWAWSFRCCYCCGGRAKCLHASWISWNWHRLNTLSLVEFRGMLRICFSQKLAKYSTNREVNVCIIYLVTCPLLKRFSKVYAMSNTKSTSVCSNLVDQLLHTAECVCAINYRKYWMKERMRDKQFKKRLMLKPVWLDLSVFSFQITLETLSFPAIFCFSVLNKLSFRQGETGLFGQHLCVCGKEWSQQKQ